jgi:hypothetical protein
MDPRDLEFDLEPKPTWLENVLLLFVGLPLCVALYGAAGVIGFWLYGRFS